MDVVVAFVHFTSDGKIDVDLQLLHNVSNPSSKYSGSGSLAVHFVNSPAVPGHHHLWGSSSIGAPPKLI